MDGTGLMIKRPIGIDRWHGPYNKRTVGMCGRYWHHHTVRGGKLQYCRWLALAFSRVEDNRDIEMALAVS
jgi:hypothetical protein